MPNFLKKIFSSGEDFTLWIKSLNGLKTFWTKPIDFANVQSEDNFWLIDAVWKVRRGCKRAKILVSDDTYIIKNLLHNPDNIEEGQICYLVVTILDFPIQLYDRRSVVYFYTHNSQFLKPNEKVMIEIYKDSLETLEILREVEKIQKMSWGFYIPPVQGDVVFLAKLKRKTVGSAYYNPLSSNVYYGIHVVKDMWRNRIGTRIMHEIIKYATTVGKSWFSVIRVLRGKKLTTSDKSRCPSTKRITQY